MRRRESGRLRLLVGRRRPGVMLSGTLTGAEQVTGLSPTRAYFKETVGGDAGKLLAQTFDSAPPTKLVDFGPSGQTFVGVFNDRVMVREQAPGPLFNMYSCDYDGGNVSFVTLNQLHPFTFDPSNSFAPDGTACLMQSFIEMGVTNPFGTFMAVAAFGASNVDLTLGNTLAPDLALLIPNDLVLEHISTGFKVLDRFTGVRGTFGNANTTTFAGVSEDWVLAYEPASKKLRNYRVDGLASNLLSANAANPGQSPRLFSPASACSATPMGRRGWPRWTSTIRLARESRAGRSTRRRR